MVVLAALLAAVTVTFPPAGTKMPALDQCYMSGAVERGVTNLTVQGKTLAEVVRIEAAKNEK